MALDEYVDSVLERLDYKRFSLSVLASKWTFFVDQCAEGYDWNIYEFDNELSVRDSIEEILNDPVFKQFYEFGGFVREVHDADERYRDLLQPNVKRTSFSESWWHTGVLKSAGDEYCSDVLRRYSILVKPFDSDFASED